MAPVQFVVPEVTIEISEGDAWKLIHTLRGAGEANDRTGHRLANLSEGKIKGSSQPITADEDEERALFAALDVMRDTAAEELSVEMQRLREAVGHGLGALPAPPPPAEGAA